MADTPINLNKARKARARADAKVQADRNAVIHGLPKAARDQAKAETTRIKGVHDGGQRDGPGKPG